MGALSFALAILLVASIAIHVVLPDLSETSAIPASLIAEFRALSLAGLTVFWVVLGLAFGALLARKSGRRRVRKIRFAGA